MWGCHVCEEVKKTIEEIEPQFPDREIQEIDMTTTEGQELMQKYSVMSSPGIVMDGEFFSTGAVGKEELVNRMRSITQ